jgi:hypothetical protein
MENITTLANEEYVKFKELEIIDTKMSSQICMNFGKQFKIFKKVHIQKQ